MTFASTATALRTRFNTNWGVTTPVAWPNVEYEPTAGTAWVRVSLGLGDNFQPYLGDGSKTRLAGVFVAEVFEPVDSADHAAWTKADTIAGFMQRAVFSGFQAGEATATETSLPPAEAAVWYRVTVEIPYYRHFTR